MMIQEKTGLRSFGGHGLEKINAPREIFKYTKSYFNYSDVLF
jgi:hypothetical protein